jgi:Tfp pilus assembly protein PilO
MTNRILIISIGVALILLGLYFFLYQPLVQRITLARRQYSVVEAELLQGRAALASLRQLQEKKTPLSENNAALAIARIENTARQKGLNVISAIAGDSHDSANRDYKIIPLEMETESTYKAIGTFLGSLADLEFAPVVVQGFTITNTQGALARLKTKLLLHLYLWKD